MKDSILFTQKSIGNLELKNRFVMTAMDVGMANFNGTPTDLLTDYYLQRVRGGVGLIITGICRVNNIHGVAEPRQISLTNNRRIKPFQEMNQKIHEEGGKIVVQIHHPGRQNYSALIGVWPLVETFSHIPGFKKLFPVAVKALNFLEKQIFTPAVTAPSVVPCTHVNQKTRALKTREIKKLIKQFIKAAKRAQKAGFDGVELHAAHGYLLQQFLSPYTNRRTDQYGGNFENRLRIMKEIIEGIQKSCGKDFPLIVRLTVDEFIPEDKIDKTLSVEDQRGITLDKGVQIAKALETMGVHALDISSGSYEQTNKWLETVTYDTGWRKYLAKAVKQEVSIPVIAANLIRSGQQALEQLEEESQDFIGLGRPLLADPELPKKIKEGREDEVNRCIVCCQCYESLVKNAWLGKPLRCSVNPTLDKSPETLSKGEGKVIVVGAGVAGMQAALTLKKRGFDVVIFEKSPYSGGQVRLADKAPKKDKLGWVVDDLEESLKQLGVVIRYNTLASQDIIMQENPRAVIIATGATPIIPPIKGKDQPQVYSFDGILSGETFPEQAQKVAVIGSGLTGLETAEYLVARGKEVIIVEMAKDIAPGAHFQHRDDAIEQLNKGKVRFLTNKKLIAIEQDTILLQSPEGGVQKERAEAVVLALGSKPENHLVATLQTAGILVQVIGDAKKIGRIADAVEEGYQTAKDLVL